MNGDSHGGRISLPRSPESPRCPRIREDLNIIKWHLIRPQPTKELLLLSLGSCQDNQRVLFPEMGVGVGASSGNPS